MMVLRTMTGFTLLSSALLLPAFSYAATPVSQASQIAPAGASSQTAGQQNWSMDQLITSTVHQAWLLSGKNEATFFEMVQQLADLSAKNRGITLPDSEAAGRRMGMYIKTSAKSDTDQLLYAVVDRAVLKTSKLPVHVAGQAR